MKNKLHTGDSLPFLESLPSSVVGALITDPPYASGGLHIGSKNRSTSEKYQNGGTARKYPEFTGDHRDQRAHLRWMTLWLSECLRVMKDGAPICLFTDWRQLPLTTDALQVAGFTWRGIAVWDKGEGVRPVMGRYRNQAEYVVWGSKGDMPTSRDVGVLRGVYKEVVKQKDKFHVTGKPTNLMRDLIKICEPGGLILDPFAGSGSTLLAAELEGYDWLGCELSEEYQAIALGRLEQLKEH